VAGWLYKSRWSAFVDLDGYRSSGSSRCSVRLPNDTGALVAAERNDRSMWAPDAGLLAEEVMPVVPAPVSPKHGGADLVK
jgi:hypothetical protein